MIELEKFVYERLKQEYGENGLIDLLREDIIWVGPSATRLNTNFSRYFTQPEMAWDEWGRGRIPDPIGQYAAYFYPLENIESVDDIIQYPWPDLDEPYRYADLFDQIEVIHSRGFAVSGGLQETIFEIAWQLRSMDRLFEDISRNDEKAVVLLDAITDRRVVAAQAYASAGVDIISLGDDVAMQNRLMLKPSMWRAWLQPRLKRVIDAARIINPNVIIEYHSDGKINDLVGDLIECGVDILNPVQPECVDHRWIKSAYGERLSFSGGLGVQSVLPFGSVDEVREHVKQAIETLGAGGGYIIGPSHVVERDVPLSNILMMLKSIDEFGVYG
jgi:uroporphyrinogen decarboxylase